MIKLLFLPLLLISCFCFGQDAKEIIGKPIKIGNLFIAQNDFPNTMTYLQAPKACRALGKGWRLPTKKELNILYKNKNKIGGFSENYYWSSTKFDSGSPWLQNFYDGEQLLSLGPQYTGSYEDLELYVRAVRTL
jgi:hypothetical protein